jgi:hypothetical protein
MLGYTEAEILGKDADVIFAPEDRQAGVPVLVCGGRFGQSPMHSELLREASSGWACDNGMAAMSIRSGDPVDPARLIELCSGARTLFSLATLVCRSLDRQMCRRSARQTNRTRWWPPVD